MSFRSLLTDRCSIYHIQETTASPGYGLPGEAEFVYADLPDLVEVPCKFTEKSQSITQGEPGAEIIQTFAMIFPVNIDVRVNDKVVFGGIECKAQLPRKVKNHHVEVTVIRKGKL